MRLILFVIIIFSLQLNSTDYNSISEVELIDFYAFFNDSVVVINLTTASEHNNKYFIIERASNYPNPEFKKLDTLEGIGFSKETNKYNTIDSTIEFGNIYYYRLSTVAFDGTIDTYLNEIALVEIPEVQTSIIQSDYKHLVDYELHEYRIIIKTSVPIRNQLSLFSLDGKTIKPKVDILNDSYYSIDISDLPQGKYVLIYNQSVICKFIR